MMGNYTALAYRLRNDVRLFSTLDWQDHVALAREAADALETLEAEAQTLRNAAVNADERADAAEAAMRKMEA